MVINIDYTVSDGCKASQTHNREKIGLDVNYFILALILPLQC